jgi:hypothetical protein
VESIVKTPLPFEQQPAETAKAYAAFVMYRDLGPERSLQETAHKLAKNLTTIKQWSTLHNWVDRARSYDAALDARARAATEGEATERRRRMIERHAQTAAKLQTAAQMILDEFNDRVAVRGGMKFVDGRMLVSMLNQVSKMLETGQKLERLAEGEPTEHITYERVMSMSDAEFEMLVRRLETEGQV